MASDPNSRMLIIYEGPKVGVDPDIAAELTRAIILESAKQGEQGRFHVASFTIARNALALRLTLSDEQLKNEKNEKAHLQEAKLIFGGIASATYRRCKGFPT